MEQTVIFQLCWFVGCYSADVSSSEAGDKAEINGKMAVIVSQYTADGYTVTTQHRQTVTD